MNFRIIAVIFFIIFFCLGLNRTEYTDDEKIYLELLNYNSENIQDFFMYALSFSSNVFHLILMKISGSYFYFLKFFFLLFSWYLIDTQLKIKKLQFRKFLPLFLFPYFFISGTFLRDDIIVTIILLIIYVYLKYENNKIKFFYLSLLLIALYFSRFYWMIIYTALITFLILKKNKKWLVISLIPITYLLLSYGNEYYQYYGSQIYEFTNLNFNVFKFLYSPIPWKISSEVGLYENIPAYWLLFVFKLFITFILISKKIKVKNWTLFYLTFPILIFQNITFLNGPRQTTIFIGLFMCSLMIQKSKYV